MNNIAFPKLGISLNISPVAFSIGSKPIYWYALIILSGFLLGLFFVYKTCEKRGVKKDNVWDIALFGLIFGIIGARIYYVLFALDEFKHRTRLTADHLCTRSFYRSSNRTFRKLCKRRSVRR